jgi:hypothetical protein
MALRQIRIGAVPNAYQYDDADYPKAISAESSIECTATPTDPNDVIRLVDVGSITGDVYGPAGSTDSNVAEFDGVTGKKIKDGSITHSSVVDAISGKFSTGLGIGGRSVPAGGIAFPAVQVAVADAHTLDDYEEGNWVPTQGTGLTVVGAFSSGGKYTKIGRLVHVVGYVYGATSVAVSAAGEICAGLPFVQDGSVGNNCGGANKNTLAAGTITAISDSSIIAVNALTACEYIEFSGTYSI